MITNKHGLRIKKSDIPLNTRYLLYSIVNQCVVGSYDNKVDLYNYLDFILKDSTKCLSQFFILKVQSLKI